MSTDAHHMTTRTRSDLAFDHGAVSRFNAWFFTAFAGYLNHISRHHKRAAYADVQPGRIVEIGAGTGANLRYLPDGAELIAVEPNLRMHDRLRRRCDAAGVPLTVLATGAEDLPLPDDHVDEIVCSLTLCTVRDIDAALGEIRRVLRPGGRFRFVEHVAAPPRSLRGRGQRLIRRPWGYLFEGCDPARHTTDAIERAGFARCDFQHERFRRSLFWPVNTAIWGIAVK